VFQKDCENAKNAYERLNAGKLSFSCKKSEILYIETDGAALNTRYNDQNGSSWRENKLGLVFSSDNLYSWHDKHGELQHQIQKKEYVSFIGSADEFQKNIYTRELFKLVLIEMYSWFYDFYVDSIENLIISTPKNQPNFDATEKIPLNFSS